MDTHTSSDDNDVRITYEQIIVCSFGYTECDPYATLTMAMPYGADPSQLERKFEHHLLEVVADDIEQMCSHEDLDGAECVDCEFSKCKLHFREATIVASDGTIIADDICGTCYDDIRFYGPSTYTPAQVNRDILGYDPENNRRRVAAFISDYTDYWRELKHGHPVSPPEIVWESRYRIVHSSRI